jgi:hypothetical protein
VKRHAQHLLHSTNNVPVANAGRFNQRKLVIAWHFDNILHLTKQILAFRRLPVQALR